MKSLEKQVAIITGGGAICLRLAEEAAFVAVTDRRHPLEVEES